MSVSTIVAVFSSVDEGWVARVISYTIIRLKLKRLF